MSGRHTNPFLRLMVCDKVNFTSAGRGPVGVAGVRTLIRGWGLFPLCNEGFMPQTAWLVAELNCDAERVLHNQKWPWT